jgi:hypothetical protein
VSFSPEICLGLETDLRSTLGPNQGPTWRVCLFLFGRWICSTCRPGAQLQYIFKSTAPSIWMLYPLLHFFCLFLSPRVIAAGTFLLD